MVGDSAFDVQMALAAECAVIGVTWGAHSEAELRAASATICANTPAELFDAL